MAGRYSKQELKDKLQRSALHLVATEGIERLSTRRLSAGCGLSDPYIYQCYSDIPELLADTFLRVDCEVAELMRTVIGTQFIAPAKPVKLADVCRLLWGAYWRYLMEDPERTVFYWRYYQSGYYNRDILAVREKNFRVFTDFIVNTGKTLGLSDDAQRLAIVTMLIDDTVSAAVRIHPTETAWSRKGRRCLPTTIGCTAGRLSAAHGSFWSEMSRRATPSRCSAAAAASL